MLLPPTGGAAAGGEGGREEGAGNEVQVEWVECSPGSSEVTAESIKPTASCSIDEWTPAP